MPFVSAEWDGWVELFGKPPAEFHAEENGQRIDYVAKPTKEEK